MRLFLAVAAAMVLLFQREPNDEQSPADGISAFDSTLYEVSRTMNWSLPVPQHVPTRFNLPVLPQAPSVPQILIGRWLTPGPLEPLLMQTLAERGNWIIDNHPERWLREELGDLLDRHQMSITYAMELKEGAAFQREAPAPVPGTTLPSLVFFAGGLINATTTRDFLKIMLSVRHEFEHYERWRKSTLEERKMFDNEANPVEYCRLRWEDEQAAILATCPLNLEWGILEDGRAVCLYDGKEFDHAFFVQNVVLQREFGNEGFPGAAICMARWAMMAGYPHPEEFQER